MTLTKALERAQKEIQALEVDWTEALVTGRDDLPSMRHIQGRIAGLRQASEILIDLRKRYNEGDDDSD